jgi:trehalose synthase
MVRIHEVHVNPRSLRRFEPILGAQTVDSVEARAHALASRLAGRAVWNVNSTASGGGVAEMLAALLVYPREYGVDARWGVIDGSPEFFSVTKRLHHALQGSPGDGSPLEDAQRSIYEGTSEENANEFRKIIRPGDIVILHDPQTAGLAPYLSDHGCHLIWRCHIGDDRTNEEEERGWAFLWPYLSQIPISIFSRHAYVPPALNRGQTLVIPPSIDPFSAKCEAIEDTTVRAVLEHIGVLAGGKTASSVQFTTLDGTTRRVERRAEVVGTEELPGWDAPLVLQVSRWDPLKDPVGVMDAFARVTQGETEAAHLMLVGPEVAGVADDPEAGEVVEATLEHWKGFPDDLKDRIHLVLLPTSDPIENATMVNALQSHASIVVQKSLREGFGLTITEAMWKSRPIVATRVGGIQDQISDGVEGLMVDDPTDLDGVAGALTQLLNDRDLSRRLGTAGRVRVVNEFLPTRHLLQYAELIENCLPPTS